MLRVKHGVPDHGVAPITAPIEMFKARTHYYAMLESNASW
jgi:hypothetical protein